VIGITAGAFHSCALLQTGGIKCWGENSSGQLGDGTTTIRLRPVDVVGFGTATATLAVVSHSVVVTPAGVAAVRLRCGSGMRCDGRLTLASGRKSIGSRSFSIAAGATRAIDVTLNAKALEALALAKRLSVRATIAYRQASGDTTTGTWTITLVK
jgi:Regulator of chromosome condensation (RCC1) repeat